VLPERIETVGFLHIEFRALGKAPAQEKTLFQMSA